MTTVRELVFGGAAGEVQAAERLAHDVSISRAVVGRVSEALDFEISDVLVWAWQTRSALLEAGRETFRQPGLVRRVTVVSYSVPWDCELKLDILLNGAHTTTITFVLTLSLEVTALAATVQRGQLTAVETGRYEVGVSLTAEGRTLVERARGFDLTQELKISRPIPLFTGT